MILAHASPFFLNIGGPGPASSFLKNSEMRANSSAGFLKPDFLKTRIPL
jgi:hypothetical protein